MSSKFRPAAKPAPMRFTLADRLRLAGQRLRANESVGRLTFALAYRARHDAAGAR